MRDCTLWHDICKVRARRHDKMTGTDLMTKRLLAVDETILNVMDNLLKMHDYDAVTATHWVEALDAINERTPDLLLLDL